MSQIPQLTVSAVPQLTVSTQNAPGELARITEILAQEDANIEGMTQTGVESSQVKTHVVVDKAAEAKKVLESQGLEVSQTDILAITCASDQPGLIATVARALGNAGINIENAYYSSGSRGNNIVIYVWVAPAQLQQALEVVKGL
ncbi:MAG: ACT domain-containing protein [Patescibacteria group bacterium]